MVPPTTLARQMWVLSISATICRYYLHCQDHTSYFAGQNRKCNVLLPPQEQSRVLHDSYAGVTLDEIPCGSPADSHRIPSVYAITPGGSAGDLVQCDTGITKDDSNVFRFLPTP